MTDWLRRAGRGRRGDDWVIWSVSEGSRGRRWREVVYSGDRVFSALLLETHPTGTFAHLELATASGLLTLHPEGDGTLHGNVVASTGIEHVIGLAWSHANVILVSGSPISEAAAILRLAGTMEPFGATSLTGLVIPATLVLDLASVSVERISQRDWRFDHNDSMSVDGRGLPVLLESEDWPLELADK
jgi:hypothetical protein